MIEIISGVRHSGKTIEMIKRAAETGACMVVKDAEEVQRVLNLAEHFGLEIIEPITFGEYINRDYHRRKAKSLIIDNVDVFFAIFSDIPISAVTFTVQRDK